MATKAEASWQIYLITSFFPFLGPEFKKRQGRGQAGSLWVKRGQAGPLWVKRGQADPLWVKRGQAGSLWLKRGQAGPLLAKRD